ncbi:MAG: phosphotransferase family protein [Pseudomonadota bacterium]|nr:phosphotransferase family protein [Pseudomonadota bacterium]
MRLVDIEELCRAVLPGTGGVAIEPLTQGLLSETYRIRRQGLAYTLKTAAPIRPQFGLSFASQVRLLERATESGLAPPLVYHDAERVLISRWVDGEVWSPQEAALPDYVGKMARLLRRVHALPIPSPAGRIGPRSWIESYSAMLLRDPKCQLDPVLTTAAAVYLREIEELPRAAGVVCHSDLHALNVLRCDQGLILLDWEYAHVSDPLWDLAGWCANNDFDSATQRELLAEYLGTLPRSHEWARFRLLMWLYDYVCLLWGELYVSLRRDASKGISGRITKLDARLHLPAHYAA